MLLSKFVGVQWLGLAETLGIVGAAGVIGPSDAKFGGAPDTKSPEMERALGADLTWARGLARERTARCSSNFNCITSTSEALSAQTAEAAKSFRAPRVELAGAVPRFRTWPTRAKWSRAILSTVLLRGFALCAVRLRSAPPLAPQAFCPPAIGKICARTTLSAAPSSLCPRTASRARILTTNLV